MNLDLNWDWADVVDGTVEPNFPGRQFPRIQFPCGNGSGSVEKSGGAVRLGDDSKDSAHSFPFLTF